MSNVTVKDAPTEHTVAADGHVGCLRGLNLRPSDYGAASLTTGLPGWREKSKRGIDWLPPAACIIIEHLFGALDALLATE